MNDFLKTVLASVITAVIGFFGGQGWEMYQSIPSLQVMEATTPMVVVKNPTKKPIYVFKATFEVKNQSPSPGDIFYHAINVDDVFFEEKTGTTYYTGIKYVVPPDLPNTFLFSIRKRPENAGKVLKGELTIYYGTQDSAYKLVIPNFELRVPK
jgi:hypothetical protein